METVTPFKIDVRVVNIIMCSCQTLSCQKFECNKYAFYEIAIETKNIDKQNSKKFKIFGNSVVKYLKLYHL